MDRSSQEHGGHGTAMWPVQGDTGRTTEPAVKALGKPGVLIGQGPVHTAGQHPSVHV